MRIVATASTRPDRSSSGPPLLPGLMAASVCTRTTAPTCRSALTMPRVTVFCRPSGDPIAMTSCPIRASRDDASGKVAWPGRASLVRMAARSRSSLRCMTRPEMASPFDSLIVTYALPSTTCALVMSVSGVDEKAGAPSPRRLDQGDGRQRR